MKFQGFCGLLTALLTSGGCEARRVRIPAAKPAAEQRISAEHAVAVGDADSDANQVDDAPRTPGGAVYGEVLAATDEIIDVLARPDAVTAIADLHRATQRFEVAARNWKMYLTNTNDAELAVMQQSRLTDHSVASGDRLRESILRVARDPAAGALLPELRELLRALKLALSATERDEFQRWLTDNRLEP
jgi:hypothetical protein